MIVTILIVFLLISGWINGLRRGFVLQVFHLARSFGALLVAWYLYDDVAPHLEKVIPAPGGTDSAWSTIQSIIPVNLAFYNVIAFLIVFIVARIAIGMIARTIDGVARLPILNTFNKLLGAILGIVETYVILFVIIAIFSVIPTAAEWVHSSQLALTILEKTPVLSEMIKGFSAI